VTLPKQYLFANLWNIALVWRSWKSSGVVRRILTAVDRMPRAVLLACLKKEQKVNRVSACEVLEGASIQRMKAACEVWGLRDEIAADVERPHSVQGTKKETMVAVDNNC
jgi:hypothetical protein